jgi:hypothetical protein
MNRALLAELQRLTAYPSVTLLLTTTPSDPMRDVDVRQLDAMVVEATLQRSTRAVALCASPDHGAIVRLGREVRQRIVVDDTFATRDMVADLNRTAVFRVVTVSDRKVRVLHGDRNRLAELRDAQWPLVRDELESTNGWSRAMADAIATECADIAMPTIVAGVARTARDVVDAAKMTPIGTINGAHDRSGWAELHQHAWPLVVDWMRQDGERAMERLDEARGAQRFAGGIDEVWMLAHDGRVQLLVVEEGYDLPARLEDGRLIAADDREAPGVIDDAVDELIEAVLRMGGETVIVPTDTLADHARVAAVLRY